MAQSSGFVTETQTFYLTLPGGKLAMCQVIHSAIGFVPPSHAFRDPVLSPSVQSSSDRELINGSGFGTLKSNLHSDLLIKRLECITGSPPT